MIAIVLSMSLGSIAAVTALGSFAATRGFPLPRGGRIDSIDGLRGYLALAVMTYHFLLWLQVAGFGLPWARSPVGLVDGLGPGSVGLFFMATGFVFYPRILDGAARTGWVALYVGRAARILPPVLVSVVIAGAVILARLDFLPRAAAGETVLAMLHWATCCGEPSLFGYPLSWAVNAGILWSLQLEWAFYLFVLPACAVAMDAARAARAPTCAIPCMLLALGLATRGRVEPGSIFLYLPHFACGMLAFELRGHAALAVGLRGRRAGMLLPGALIAGHCAGDGLARLACHAIFFVGIAAGNDLGGLLRRPGARVLGEASFAIYLLHGIVLNILFVDISAASGGLPVAAAVAALPLAMAGVVLVAMLSYIAIERPMIAVGRRVGAALARPAAARLIPAAG